MAVLERWCVQELWKVQMSNRETLVLIPGLACTRAVFEPQINAFGDRYDVVVPDHTQGDTLGEIASGLLAAAPQSFALAGFSMGGYVALEVMRQAPDRIRRLALIDTTARPDTEEAKERRRRLIALAEAGRLQDIHSLLWERLVHPDRRSDRELEGIAQRMLRDTGSNAFIRQQRAIMARPDSRPTLPGIEIPTLVLVGAEDQITPPEHAREMADMIEWASLVIIPDSGHLSLLEQPESVQRALEAWLSTN